MSFNDSLRRQTEAIKQDPPDRVGVNIKCENSSRTQWGKLKIPFRTEFDANTLLTEVFRTLERESEKNLRFTMLDVGRSTSGISFLFNNTNETLAYYDSNDINIILNEKAFVQNSNHAEDEASPYNYREEPAFSGSSSWNGTDSTEDDEEDKNFQVAAEFRPNPHNTDGRVWGQCDFDESADREISNQLKGHFDLLETTHFRTDNIILDKLETTCQRIKDCIFRKLAKQLLSPLYEDRSNIITLIKDANQYLQIEPHPQH